MPKPAQQRAAEWLRPVDFIIQRPRRILPVVMGQYERRHLQPSPPPPTGMPGSADPGYVPLRRFLNRPDILPNRIAYATSAGSTLILTTALEPRFQAAVLLDAGLPYVVSPEFDVLNFAPRVKLPVLMFNGRYDFTFPVQDSQNPLFQFLGTAEADKRHVLFDAAHDSLLFRTDLVREVLAWLDKYLGTVKK